MCDEQSTGRKVRGTNIPGEEQLVRVRIVRGRNVRIPTTVLFHAEILHNPLETSLFSKLSCPFSPLLVCLVCCHAIVHADFISTTPTSTCRLHLLLFYL